MFRQLNEKFEPNTQYTIQVEWANEGTLNYAGWLIGVKYTDDSSEILLACPQNQTSLIKHVATSAANKTIKFFYSTYGTGGYTYLANIKLEKGTKATDWSPAPEDAVYSHPNVDGITNYILYPQCYQDRNYTMADSVTGILKIVLPTVHNTMVKFTVSIYNYISGTSVDYIISGYIHSQGLYWYNTTATCVGHQGRSLSNLSVRFYYDANLSKFCVGIGETTTVWNYPNIVMHDLTLGFSGHIGYRWRSGWRVYIDTVSPSNVYEHWQKTNVAPLMNLNGTTLDITL